MLTSDPPMVVDKCCYCGETRALRLVAAVPTGDHGPFAPVTRYLETRTPEASLIAAEEARKASPHRFGTTP